MLNLWVSSDSLEDELDGCVGLRCRGRCRGRCFSEIFQRSTGSSASREGKISPRGGAAVMSVGGNRGGGNHHRYRALRREEAFLVTPVSSVPRGHAGARSSGRYPRYARCRAIPTLLRGLGRLSDRG